MNPKLDHGMEPGLSTPPLPATGWCQAARVDPITGLIAFPDFHAWFPDILARTLASGAAVGLAIGDVDNLKEYVEDTKRETPACFGHLAGYAVMSELGAIARAWFLERAMGPGCLATFGGDEIILALQTEEPATFLEMVGDLSGRLNLSLPRTVSFAAGIVEPAAQPDQLHNGWTQELYVSALSTLDRHLFQVKANRRSSPGRQRTGLLTVVDLASQAIEAMEAIA